MRLKYAEIKEMQAIISGLSEQDKERISAEVERLAKGADPITTILRNFKPDEHTADAVEYLEGDDVDYQEKSSEWFWDALTARVTAEYAFGIFKAKHEHREAA